MNTTELTEADVLVEAMARIEEAERWGQGHGIDPPSGGRLCLLDSLPMSSLYHNEQWYERLSRLTDYSLLQEWNDEPERTHADVMGLFRRALVDLAREHIGG